MKEITIKLYNYHELSDGARESAERNLEKKFNDEWNEMEINYLNDYIPEILKKDYALDIFSQKLYWNVFTQGEFFTMESDLYITEELLLKLGYNKNDSVFEELLYIGDISLKSNKFNDFVDEESVYNWLDNEKDEEIFINRLNEYLEDTYNDMLETVKSSFLWIGCQEYINDYINGMDIYFTENGDIFEY